MFETVFNWIFIKTCVPVLQFCILPYIIYILHRIFDAKTIALNFYELNFMNVTHPREIIDQHNYIHVYRQCVYGVKHAGKSYLIRKQIL